MVSLSFILQIYFRLCPGLGASAFNTTAQGDFVSKVKGWELGELLVDTTFSSNESSKFSGDERSTGLRL